ncbi:hypothetical protein V1634_21630 [Plantactinospora veratri]|uniref:Uncharacterized protein n=1 Tax=Plantactinospora veratri TaxID=1436122 RepID=A0ABU7SIN9_9ACTN
MEIFRNWWVRLTAVLGTAALTVFVPAVAWASSGPGEMVLEAARGRRARGSFGIWGLVCCLIVVGVIVAVLVLVMRNRRSGGKR